MKFATPQKKTATTDVDCIAAHVQCVDSEMSATEESFKVRKSITNMCSGCSSSSSKMNELLNIINLNRAN